LADGQCRARLGAADTVMVERRADRGAELSDGRELVGLTERQLGRGAWIEERRGADRAAAVSADAKARRELVLWAALRAACQSRELRRGPRVLRQRERRLRLLQLERTLELAQLRQECLQLDAQESLRALSVSLHLCQLRELLLVRRQLRAR
jgi:hypothetical protein